LGRRVFLSQRTKGSTLFPRNRDCVGLHFLVTENISVEGLFKLQQKMLYRHSMTYLSLFSQGPRPWHLSLTPSR
jgi:hypothetical protein